MYYDLITKIRNATKARKLALRVPFSGMDFEVAKVLETAHFVKDVKKKTYDKKHFIEVELPAHDDEEHMIRGFKAMSTSGRRLYVGYRGIQKMRQGYGLAVLSTPKGIMTSQEARKQKVGGEYLFEIW